MASVQRELVERISRLDSENQRRVLEFVRSLEEAQPASRHSARDLIKLPVEERNRLVIQTLERTGDDDIDLF